MLHYSDPAQPLPLDTNRYLPPAGESWGASAWEPSIAQQSRSQAAPKSKLIEKAASGILVFAMFVGVAASLFFVGRYVDSGLRRLSSLSFVEEINGSSKVGASGFGRNISGSSLTPSSR